jgi:hypothetical protein
MTLGHVTLIRVYSRASAPLFLQESYYITTNPTHSIYYATNKVLAPHIIYKYALSKGFAKGLQGVYNAYCNRLGNYLFCFSS